MSVYADYQKKAGIFAPKATAPVVAPEETTQKQPSFWDKILGRTPEPVAEQPAPAPAPEAPKGSVYEEYLKKQQAQPAPAPSMVPTSLSTSTAPSVKPATPPAQAKPAGSVYDQYKASQPKTLELEKLDLNIKDIESPIISTSKAELAKLPQATISQGKFAPTTGKSPMWAQAIVDDKKNKSTTDKVLESGGFKQTFAEKTAGRDEIYSTVKLANNKYYAQLGKDIGLDKYVDLPSMLSPEERDRRLAHAVQKNISYISSVTGAPKQVATFEEAEKNVNAIKDKFGIERGKTKPEELAEVVSLGFGLLAAPALLAAPIATVLGLGAFTAIDKGAKKILSMATGKEVQNFSDALPDNTGETTKVLVDILGLIAETYAVHGVYKFGGKAIEPYTKQIITQYKLPERVTLDSSLIRRAQILGKEQGLGMTPSEEKAFSAWLETLPAGTAGNKARLDALKNGVTIELPAEKLITIADRPWFAKVKAMIRPIATEGDRKIFGLNGEPEVTRTPLGEAKITPRGFLTEGTPASVTPAPAVAPVPPTPAVKAPIEYGKVEKIPVAKIKPTETSSVINESIKAGKTPKEVMDNISRAGLYDSIAKDGIKEPISVIRNSDGTFSVGKDGIHRFEIARVLGIKDIPVVIENPAPAPVAPLGTKKATAPKVQAPATTDTYGITPEDKIYFKGVMQKQGIKNPTEEQLTNFIEEEMTARYSPTEKGLKEMSKTEKPKEKETYGAPAPTTLVFKGVEGNYHVAYLNSETFGRVIEITTGKPKKGFSQEPNEISETGYRRLEIPEGTPTPKNASEIKKLAQELLDLDVANDAKASVELAEAPTRPATPEMDRVAAEFSEPSTQMERLNELSQKKYGESFESLPKSKRLEIVTQSRTKSQDYPILGDLATTLKLLATPKSNLKLGGMKFDDFVYGGVENGIFTDAYMLISKKEVALEALNKLIEADKKLSFKQFRKQLPEATAGEINELIEDDIKSKKSSIQFPDVKQIMPNENQIGGELKFHGEVSTLGSPVGLFVSGKEKITLNLDYVAFMQKHLPDAKMHIHQAYHGVNAPGKPVIFVEKGKVVGLLMGIQGDEFSKVKIGEPKPKTQKQVVSEKPKNPRLKKAGNSLGKKLPADASFEEGVALLQKQYPDGLTLYHQTGAGDAIRKSGFIGDADGNVYFSVLEAPEGRVGGTTEAIKIVLPPKEYGMIGVDEGSYKGATEEEQFIDMINGGMKGADIVISPEIANKYLKQNPLAGKQGKLSVKDLAVGDEIKIAKKDGQVRVGVVKKLYDYENELRAEIDYADAPMFGSRSVADSTGAEITKYKLSKSELAKVEATRLRLKDASDHMLGKGKYADKESIISVYKRDIVDKAIAEGKAVDINPDTAKKFFKDFSPEAHRVYSDAVMNEVLDYALLKVKNPIVRSTAGGPGSGKSDFAQQILADGFNGIVIDHSMASNAFVEKIATRIEAAGKKLEITGILPEIKTAYFYAQKRAVEGDEAGRVIPDDIFAARHADVIDMYKAQSKTGRLVGLVDLQGVNDIKTGIERAKNPLIGDAIVDRLKDVGYTKDEITKQIHANQPRISEKPLSIPSESRANPAGKSDTGKGLGQGAGKNFGGGSGRASIGNYKDGTPIEAGHLESIKPIEFPEIVDLARELMGKVPDVKAPNRMSKMGGAPNRGTFFGSMPKGEIELNAELFKKGSLEQVAKTLAHEIGHLTDWLPDMNLSRGNLLGRLATLRKYRGSILGENFEPMTMKSIVKQVKDEVLAETGISIDEYIKSPEAKKKVNKLVNERKEAILEEAKNSGTLLKDIKAELIKVSEYWRPPQIEVPVIDPETGLQKIETKEVAGGVVETPVFEMKDIPISEIRSEGYRKYRMQPDELYADAISMLFNSPGTLEKMAPKFYQRFFEALDRKPKVKEAFFELQDILSGNEEVLIQHRREGVKGMFGKAGIKAADLYHQRIAEKKITAKDLLSRLKFELITKHQPIIDRINELEKKGTPVNEDENPLYYLRESNYLGGKIKAITEKTFGKAYENLQEAGISWDSFGEALFYERIVSGDRSEQANPRGIRPDDAAKNYEALKKELGPEKTQILADNIELFRSGVRQVSEDAFKAGLYKQELYQKMLDNPAYASFQVVDHMELTMSSKVYQSIGTLKDISNPADATILKTISTIRAIERNRVAGSVKKFLLDNFPADITSAKTRWNGKFREIVDPQKRDGELLIHMVEGSPEGYYVDQYIAQSMQRSTIGDNSAILKGLKIANSKSFRPLFITFNLGFQSFNLLRDFQRFYKNTPGMTIIRAMGLYRKSFLGAKMRAFGLPANPTPADIEANNLILKAEESKVLSVTMNDILKGEHVEDAQIKNILKTAGLENFGSSPIKNPILRPVVRVLKFIEDMGNLIESLPKVAGIYELTKNGGELTPSQRDFIRRNVGSPDFLDGGWAKPITNEVFLFSNAIIQGIKSDLEIATGPKTRAGYWWKTAKITIIPKLLMYLAGLGLAGASVKSMMDDASEYDKTNYTIIPVGKDQNGKTTYIRIPQDETSRLIGGILWKLLHIGQGEQSVTRDAQDILSLLGGQVPSLTPTISAPIAVAQYATGQNPYDSFRGRNVLTDTEFKAGGLYSAKPFAYWLLQSLGAGTFLNFNVHDYAPKAEGPLQKVIGLPIVSNIFGRFIKVSDYGMTEQLQDIKGAIQGEAARRTMDENAAINDAVRDYRKNGGDAKTYQNQALKEIFGAGQLTKKEDITRAERIIQKFKVAVIKGSADARLNSLIDAVTNEEKRALLTKFKKDLSRPEFIELLKTAVSEKIVSSAALSGL